MSHDHHHNHDQFDTKAARFNAGEDVGRNPAANPTMGDIIALRMGRRDLLKGALATSVLAAIGGMAVALPKEARAAASRFKFNEIANGVDETHHVAEGYDANILIRWGDPVLPGAPAFDPMKQTATAQAMQFGYNNDFIGFVPLPAASKNINDGSKNSDHGLLCINHEYTDEEVMFPGLGEEQSAAKFAKMTKELVDIEIAANGGSIIEVRREGGKWTVIQGEYNRRITASTPMEITGPARGHDRMKTTEDPSGTTVLGTFNNCAGGITPWGTYLMGEENFNGYFLNKVAEDHPEAAAHKRYGVPGDWYAWANFHQRFDAAKEPHEPNRFGWIVEVDPYDPKSMPKKRTALGRFKHEGCSVTVNKDGTVVAYSGDDERFEYIYKFVAAKKFDKKDRRANMDILEEGTLHVAKFAADGSVEWLPLVFGEGPLTAENGFKNQGDVVIEARRAADLLGATKMDRPEDVEVNPKTGKVYAMLTNNSKRKADQTDAVNARPENFWGQVLEMTAPNGDHTAKKFTWSLVVQGGNPADPKTGGAFSNATSENGWFACPDNVAFDSAGRMWISTDQGGEWKKASGKSDGLYAVETDGDGRGTSKFFFRTPVGAELCGPCFTPDDQALFVAVQHPGVDGTKEFEPFKRVSTFEDPATRWPDFKEGMPPRPSVVVVTKQGGGKIA